MDTYSEYVIPVAFPQQLWLRERASGLRLYLRTLPVLLLSVICEMRSVPRTGHFSPMKNTDVIGGELVRRACLDVVEKCAGYSSAGTRSPPASPRSPCNS